MRSGVGRENEHTGRTGLKHFERFIGHGDIAGACNDRGICGYGVAHDGAARVVRGRIDRDPIIQCGYIPRATNQGVQSD